MSEKRRGLGRGLGALIPSGSPTTPRPPGDRPIDVFFPGKQSVSTAVIDAPVVDASEAGATAAAEADPRTDEESAQGRDADVTDSAPASTDTAATAGAEAPEVTETTEATEASEATQTGEAPPSADASEAPAVPGAVGTETAAPGTADDSTDDSVEAVTATAEPVSRETRQDEPTGPASPAEAPATIDVRDSSQAATPQEQPTAPQAEPGPAWDQNGEAPRPTPGEVSRETTRGRDEVELVPVPGARFAELPVGQITPNPKQPRTVFDEEAMAELVHSISEIGVLQPIVVRPVNAVDGEPRYELIMGERRWRATQEAGLDVVPAIIRETQDDDLLRDALLENLHRSQLNPLEEAAAYSQLLEDFGCTHEDLATKIGRSRPQISNTLRLLRLPPLVQRRVAAGVLSAGHARALLGLEDAAAMERLAQRIVAEGLSVRSVEEIVAMGDGDIAPAPRRPRAGGRSPELDDLASRLSDRLDTRVKIALGRSKGRLTVEFASVEDLNRILGVIAPQENGAFRGSVED